MSICRRSSLTLAVTLLLAPAIIAQTNTFPGDGNVGIGTTSPWAKLEISGGDIALRDTVGHRAYILKSYNDGTSLWVLATGGNDPRLMLGSSHDWDKQVTFQYLPGEVGAAGGELTIGQFWKNAPNWTHGFTRFITNGSERVRIDPAGKVGIGTAGPRERLELAGNLFIENGEAASIFPSGHSLFFGGRQDYAHVSYTFRPSWGTPSETFATLLVQKADTAGTFETRAQVSSEGPTFFNGGNVGIGTTAPTHKLSVNGTVKAKEVIVETSGWSDYVFADDYRLAPLSEVEAHIKAEKRLPGIPSERQVAEQGVSVGQMQAALLAKVEELTLHIIEQERLRQEQVEALMRKNDELCRRVQQLEQRQ